MIHKLPSSIPGHVHVVFELPASLWADRVHLAGDFNNWDVTATPFVQGRDGVWRASLELPAGTRHEFRYLVDGNWYTDYHADGCVENDYSSWNSVVEATLIDMLEECQEGHGLVHEQAAGELALGHARPTRRTMIAPRARRMAEVQRVQQKAA